MANVEAFTRRESDKTSGYLIDKWEDKYLSHNKKGELIWIVEGATVCYEDMGDEPECYESYYYYEEPY